MPTEKPQRGDIVHVRGTVTNVDHGAHSVAIDFGGCHIVDRAQVPYAARWLNWTDIVHIEPRPIAVGDTVRATFPGFLVDTARMHVNAIVDGRAWCRSSVYGYDYIIEVEKLERVS